MNNRQSQDSMLLALEEYYNFRPSSGTDTVEALGWENKYAQERRFQVLVDTLALENKSLLDVGAGFADLCIYLRACGYSCQYEGTELVKSFLSIGRSRVGADKIHEVDIIAKPDYFLNRQFDIVYASGPFNLSSYSSMDFLKQGFETFCRISKSHVVISLLNVASPEPEAMYCYFEPDAVLQELARPDFFLQVIDGYLPNDFTLLAERIA